MNKRFFSFMLNDVLLRKACLTIFLVLSMTTLLFAEVSQYEGNYSGTFEGDDQWRDQGKWVSVIEPSGDVGIILWSDEYNVVDGGKMSIDAAGHISGNTERGAEIDVNVDDDGSVTGQWRHTSLDMESDLAGEKNDDEAVAVYSGSYEGTFEDDAGMMSGAWSIDAESNGYISGTIKMPTGSIDLEGAVDSSGNLIAYAETGEGIKGEIDDNGQVNGFWSRRVGVENEAQYSGTFSGNER